LTAHGISFGGIEIFLKHGQWVRNPLDEKYTQILTDWNALAVVFYPVKLS